MMDGPDMEEFIDYYELLQISPNAELATIQRVHKLLLSRYHPDNPESGDTEKFLLLQQAVQVLTDPAARVEYDKKLVAHAAQPDPVFEMKEFVVGIGVEAHRRLGVLCLLYNRRRGVPDHPGLSLLDLEARMAIPREHLEFTIWYLRDKELAERDSNTSEITITSKGVDYVENNTRESKIVHKLLREARPEPVEQA
jgi:curved DNA-binding protein CbpA